MFYRFSFIGSLGELSLKFLLCADNVALTKIACDK